MTAPSSRKPLHHQQRRKSVTSCPCPFQRHKYSRAPFVRPMRIPYSIVKDTPQVTPFLSTVCAWHLHLIISPHPYAAWPPRAHTHLVTLCHSTNTFSSVDSKSSPFAGRGGRRLPPITAMPLILSLVHQLTTTHFCLRLALCQASHSFMSPTILPNFPCLISPSSQTALPSGTPLKAAYLALSHHPLPCHFLSSSAPPVVTTV